MTTTDMKPKSKLEKLKEQQKKLAAKIQLAEARTKTAERKKDTRRKILIGSYYLEKAISEKKMDDLTKLMDKFLVRNGDRVLFGLAEISK